MGLKNPSPTLPVGYRIYRRQGERRRQSESRPRRLKMRVTQANRSAGSCETCQLCLDKVPVDYFATPVEVPFSTEVSEVRKKHLRLSSRDTEGTLYQEVRPASAVAHTTTCCTVCRIQQGNSFRPSRREITTARMSTSTAGIVSWSFLAVAWLVCSVSYLLSDMDPPNFQTKTWTLLHCMVHELICHVENYGLVVADT